MVDNVKRMIEWFYDIKKSKPNDVFGFWDIDSFEPKTIVDINRDIFNCDGSDRVWNLTVLA